MKTDKITKRLRELKGALEIDLGHEVSDATFAYHLDLSPQILYAYKRGASKPSISSLTKIAALEKRLGVEAK